MSTSQLDIAVISDLHCKHGGDKSLLDSQTFLTTDLDLRPISRHPIEALKKMIKEEKLEADFVVCPGDIADRMDKTGLFTGWKYLSEIKTSLKTDILYATVGNHDVDSRKKHSNPHAFDIIKQLSETNFPTSNSSLNQKYWAEEFCIIDEPAYVVVNFNSCFSHTDEKGAQICIIKTDTIDIIENELKTIVDLDHKFKICLLHHHPQHHSNFDLKFKDSDFVTNGDKFLERLEKYDFQIVIHGHKHEPKLRYNGRLPVFSSGSFSSMMNIVDIGAQNTFHLITLFGNSKNGIIKSWSYGPTKGWSQDDGTYFPSNTGFGSLKSPEDIGDACNNFFAAQKKDFVSFNSIAKAIPEINFLPPNEQSRLNNILNDKYGLKIYPSIFNKPEILIKLHT